ncbi:hypothetical protein JTE90_016903 [Oedothorax gibbosus]|uniref:Uncharacterized protein n=1 Tax=Oedothorax gibbosus TaxID=931172 RepID=A0AAV6UU39_9ARAC|nr:hypothetical protein JTE90_016903 [Oedothorax gibbosus]
MCGLLEIHQVSLSWNSKIKGMQKKQYLNLMERAYVVKESGWKCRMGKLAETGAEVETGVLVLLGVQDTQEAEAAVQDTMEGIGADRIQETDDKQVCQRVKKFMTFEGVQPIVYISLF